MFLSLTIKFRNGELLQMFSSFRSSSFASELLFLLVLIFCFAVAATVLSVPWALHAKEFISCKYTASLV